MATPVELIWMHSALETFVDLFFQTFLEKEVNEIENEFKNP